MNPIFFIIKIYTKVYQVVYLLLYFCLVAVMILVALIQVAQGLLDKVMLAVKEILPAQMRAEVVALVVLALTQPSM